MQIIEIVKEDPEEAELMNAWIARLNAPKKEYSSIISTLNRCIPLPDFTHIKRVSNRVPFDPFTDDSQLKMPHPDRPMYVFLATETEFPNRDAVLEFLHAIEGWKVDWLDASSLQLIQLPRRPLPTYEDFLEWRLKWSVGYHPVRGTDPAEISVEDLTRTQYDRISKYLRMAQIQAQRARHNGCMSIGCVIVDPSTERVMAQCGDLRPAAFRPHSFCQGDIVHC